MLNQIAERPEDLNRRKGGNSVAEERYVYLFDEVSLAEKSVGGEWEGGRSLLGGKGANLAEMTRLGVPVPPGFTITTEACNAFRANNNRLPGGVWPQALASIQ